MPFPADEVTTLVLPEGAISGERIEIGPGTNILAFDSANVLIGQFATDGAGNMVIASIDQSDARAALVAASAGAFLELRPELWATHTRDPANISADIAEGAQRGRLVFVGPTVDGQEPARLFLNGEAADGSTGPEIAFDGDALPVVLLANGRHLGLGIIAGGSFVSTGNDSARAAGVATDMSCTVALLAGRAYRVTLHTQVTLGTASVDYGFELEHDGTRVGRFRRIGSSESGDTIAHLSHPVIYVPAADDSSATLALVNAGTSAGSITCQGSATLPRRLTVEDIGRP